MLIGIDAQKAASKKRTGPENFIYQLILHLKKIDQQNTYYLYTNKTLPKELTGPNFIEKKIPIARGWNQAILPMLLKIYKPDAYLQPVDKIPKGAPKKTLAVVHDLAFKYFSEGYSESELKLQNETLQNYFEKAAEIVCVSNSTKNDFLKYFPESENQCHVVYLGIDQEANSEPKTAASPYDFPYILSVGRLETRKNTARIIEAFDRAKSQGKINHKLILVGNPGTGYDKVQEALNNAKHKDDIILLGHVQQEKLQAIFLNADLFLFPSLYEGFGLALLEALSYGLPVITSNSSSIPEVAGDAAILINPENTTELENAIEMIITDENLQKELKQKALRQAKHFDWTKTAKEFKAILENL